MKHIIIGVNVDSTSPKQAAVDLRTIADMIEEDGWDGSSVYETDGPGSCTKASVIRENIKSKGK